MKGQPIKLHIVRVCTMRTFRPWHWCPRIYNGVNGVTTRLFVWGWLSIEYGGHWQDSAPYKEEKTSEF